MANRDEQKIGFDEFNDEFVQQRLMSQRFGLQVHVNQPANDKTGKGRKDKTCHTKDGNDQIHLDFTIQGLSDECGVRKER